MKRGQQNQRFGAGRLAIDLYRAVSPLAKAIRLVQSAAYIPGYLGPTSEPSGEHSGRSTGTAEAHCWGAPDCQTAPSARHIAEILAGEDKQLHHPNPVQGSGTSEVALAFIETWSPNPDLFVFVFSLDLFPCLAGFAWAWGSEFPGLGSLSPKSHQGAVGVNPKARPQRRLGAAPGCPRSKGSN